MFNFYVFQQSALILLCLVLIVGNGYAAWRHQWWVVKLGCTASALLAAAAIAGLVCA